MYSCPRCGTEIPLTENSCPQCGATVDSIRKLFLANPDVPPERPTPILPYTLLFVCCGLIAAAVLYHY